jgi:hypothetical protein
MTLNASPRLPLRLPFAKRSGRVPFPNPFTPSMPLPVWVPAGAAFFLDGVNDRAWVRGASFMSLADLALNAAYGTFSRASTGLYLPTSGVYQSFTSGQIRRGDKGMLIEPATLNGFKNSGMSGYTLGYTGSGGSMPNMGFGSTGATINSVDVLANGLTAIDFSWNYTNSTGTVQYPRFSNQVADMPAAAIGQLWRASAYIEVISSNFGMSLLIQERDAGGTYLSGVSAGSIVAPGFYEASRTLQTAGVAKTEWAFGPAVPAGQTLVSRVRIAAPQLEQNSKRTTPIITPQNSTATRAADALKILPDAGTYNITVTFDDNSTQVLSGQVITGAGWTVPTNLNRAYVKTIAGYAA